MLSNCSILIGVVERGGVDGAETGGLGLATLVSNGLLSAAWRGDMAWEVRAALFSFATAALKLKACEFTKLTPLVSD